jgi:hypothetical protein
MSGIALLLAGLVVAPPHGRTSEPPAAALKLRALQGQILVGEPEKVSIVWSSNTLVTINRTGTYMFLDAGEGFSMYRPDPGPAHSDQLLSPQLPIFMTDVLSAYATDGTREHFAFAFPKPGRYRLKVEGSYRRGGQITKVESNIVTIDVRPPSGRDAELFAQYLQHHPEWVTHDWGLATSEKDLEILRRLLTEYRGSPYLVRAQLKCWLDGVTRATKAELRKNPEARGNEGLSKSAEILDETESSVFSGSPFDEDRLLLLARMRAHSGDQDAARRSYQEIVDRYPVGEAAEIAKEWIAANIP